MADEVNIASTIISGLQDVLPSDITLKHVAIVIVTFVLFTRVFKVGIGHVFALVLCLVILFKVHQEEKVDDNSFLTQVEARWKSLGSPSHLYHDVNIVNLFYNMLPWRKLNAYNYDQAIAAVNNVLKLESETYDMTEFCVDNYDVAMEQVSLSMNLVHGFIYSLEEPLLVQKLRNVLKRLRSLLERHLDVIRGNCKMQEKNKGRPNIYTRYIQDAKSVKPFDDTKMSPFEFY